MQMEPQRKNMKRQKHNYSVTRRGFLKGTVIAAAPLVVPGSVLGLNGAVAPSNRITMGFIGVGNQGTNDMRNFLRDDRVQVIAVCDVNTEGPGYWNGSVRGREPARKMVDATNKRNKRGGKGCDAYADFRELLARKDIDAVEVCTPDHWHGYQVVAAARAGKDIYCQKPLALTINEGRIMSDVVKATKRVFQCGSQQRSDARFRPRYPRDPHPP